MNWDLVNHIKLYRINCNLPIEQWAQFDNSIKDQICNEREWREFKYIINGHLNEDGLRQVPTRKGGIYTFHIAPDIIPNGHKYLIYIGESWLTKTRNLRVRIREYYNYCTESKYADRMTLQDTFHYWKDHIYCYYLPLGIQNNEIEIVEDELIDKLIPPCNAKFKSDEVKQAVSAFQTR